MEKEIAIILCIVIVLICIVVLVISKLLNNAEIKLKELQRNNYDVEKENYDLRKDINKLHNILQYYDKSFEEKNEELEELRKENVEICRQYDELLNCKEENEKTIASLNKKIVSLQGKLNEKTNFYEEKLHQNKEEIKSKEAEIKEVIADKDILQGKLNEMQIKLDAIKLPNVTSKKFAKMFSTRFNSYQVAQCNFIEQQMVKLQQIIAFNGEDVKGLVNLVKYKEIFLREVELEQDGNKVRTIQVVLTLKMLKIIHDAGFKVSEIRYLFKNGGSVTSKDNSLKLESENIKWKTGNIVSSMPFNVDKNDSYADNLYRNLLNYKLVLGCFSVQLFANYVSNIYTAIPKNSDVGKEFVLATSPILKNDIESIEMIITKI